MRNRIRLFGGKKTEIFHLDNQVGAIAFIPVLNVIYYLLTLVTARGRRFALFLETVLLLAIGSLLIRLSTGWLLGAVFAHVLTCIGIGIQQQLLDASPDSRKKLGYVILFSRYLCWPCWRSHLQAGMRRTKCSRSARRPWRL